MSDTVQLAIVAGFVTIATLVIKHFIDEHAKKAEAKREAAEAAALAAAALEAAKLTQKLDAVEIKIDGRLTQLLEITKTAYLAKGKIEGKAEEKEKQIEVVQQTATIPDHPISSATDLKITGGEMKITTESKKKK